MKKIIFLSALLILAFVIAPMALVLAQPPSPEAVVQKLANALNTGDVASALARFDRRAFISLIPPVRPGSPVTISGSEEILKWLEDLNASHFKIKIEILATHGNIVITNTSTWDDQTTALGMAPLLANEIYVVQNGQIMGLIWVLSDDSAKKLATALAVLLPGPVKVADIVGTWSWQSGAFFLRFNADGTYRAQDTLLGLDSDFPQDIGQFQIDGKRITMTSGKGTINCHEGEAGVYEIAVTRGGQLQFTLQKDDCGMRQAPSNKPQLFDRVPGK